MSKKEKKYGVPVARNGVGRSKEVNFSFKRLRKYIKFVSTIELRKYMEGLKEGNTPYTPLTPNQMDDKARKFL
jgi:hypothetical protein